MHVHIEIESSMISLQRKGFFLPMTEENINWNLKVKSAYKSGWYDWRVSIWLIDWLIDIPAQTKCERYWPDPTFRMQEKYGDIVVTFDSAIGRDGYQITSLIISHSQVSSTHFIACLFACLPAYLCLPLPACLSVCLYLSVCSSICLSTRVSVCPLSCC